MSKTVEKFPKIDFWSTAITIKYVMLLSMNWELFCFVYCFFFFFDNWFSSWMGGRWSLILCKNEAAFNWTSSKDASNIVCLRCWCQCWSSMNLTTFFEFKCHNYLNDRLSRFDYTMIIIVDENDFIQALTQSDQRLKENLDHLPVY